MRRLLHSCIDLLIPPACAACGAGVGARRLLCAPCDASLRRMPPGGCPLCGGTAPGPGPCPPCRDAGSPLDACVAAVAFAGGVEELVHRFKYPAAGLAGLDPGPAAALSGLMLEAAARAPGAAPDAVVPVPLHPLRLRTRGFNPAAELARGLAGSLGRHHAPELLVRVRDTPSQTGLSRVERRRNVAGAFRPGRRPPPAVVWLVDDVTTTGATLAEAARALRAAGARRIVGVCAARTPAPR